MANAGQILQNIGKLRAKTPTLSASLRSLHAGLKTADASRDYIHLYHGDRDALAASLDRIQRAASRILKAVAAGG